jgi:hypothetical protein
VLLPFCPRCARHESSRVTSSHVSQIAQFKRPRPSSIVVVIYHWQVGHEQQQCQPVVLATVQADQGAVDFPLGELELPVTPLGAEG